MGTTLTIDDDLIDEVRKRAEEDGRTISQTVSDLLRQALDDAAPIEYPDGFQPLPLRPGQPRITMERVNRLRDELP